jgi:D-inositol-3-phosphate glycosyltransferase
VRAAFILNAKRQSGLRSVGRSKPFVRHTPWVFADVPLLGPNAAVNIAMVSAQASPLATTGGDDGGAQSPHVAELSAALARRGHRVTVYTRRDDPGLPQSVETPQGYNVIHVSAGPPERLADDGLLRAMGPFARYLAATWAKDRPDVAHAHFWMSGIATELVARQLNLSTVVRFHGLGTDGLRRRLESKVARTATGVAASCTDEAFGLIRMGRPRRGTCVIPSGVDVDVFTPDGPRPPRGDLLRVVSVGKLLPGNGFDTMISALPFIADAEFVVVGEAATGGSDREACRLRGLAEQLGVAHRLRLYGAATAADMPALLRSADVVACTPWYESSGAVALKAMACGVPVVARAVGALLDIVVDDVTGCLVARDDPREFAASVNSLLQDSFLRRSLGGAGRDRAVARYTWDRIAADTARLYAKSLSARCGGPTAASG